MAAASGAALGRDRQYGDFIVDSEHGVSGPYALGEFAGAAFAASGTLYVVRESGTLHRARRRSDGTWTELDPVGTVPHVAGWRVGGIVMATFEAEFVFASSDEGKTWSKTSLGKGLAIDALATRSDDVLVATTVDAAGRSTFVSNDRGKSFKKTVRVDHVARYGDSIYGLDTCGAEDIWTALAVDGLSWVIVAPPTASQGASTDGMFKASTEVGAVPRTLEPWGDDLVPPNAGLPKFPGQRLCKQRKGHGRRTKVVKMTETIYEMSSLCSGLGCLRNWRVPPPRMSRSSAYLLHDAICVPAPNEPTRCAAPLSLVRSPHAVFVSDSETTPASKRSVRVESLPSGCHPRFVTYSSGLIVLACAELTGETSIYVSSSEGPWTKEAQLAIDSLTDSDFEMRWDGTAMFANYGHRDHPRPRAWVRSPVNIGTAGAWREVTRERAAGYVLQTNGVVDVVLAEPDRGSTAFTLIEDAPAKAPRELLSHAVVGADLWCLGRRDAVISGVRQVGPDTFESIVFGSEGIKVVRTFDEAGFWNLLRSHRGMCGEPDF